MTITASAPTWVAPKLGRRVQGGVVIAILVASVVLTAALVATPAPAGSSTGMVAESANRPFPSGTRVSIEGGDAFSTFELADRLKAFGAELRAIEPAASSTDVESETTILYYERSEQETANRVRAMLGRGTLRRQARFLPGVDVTIVLGKDLSHL